MTILTNPYMQTGNAHLLPIDRNDPSLVLYLPLWYPHGDMTGSTIYSYDKNRHSCAVTGAVWGSTGRTFAGAGYIDCTNNSLLNFTTSEFSIEAWVKTTNLTASNVIFCRGLYNEDGYFFQIHNAGRLEFFSNQTPAADQRVYTADSLISTGVWYHVVAIKKNGSSGKLYINGSDVTAAAITMTNPTTSTKKALIGVYNPLNFAFVIGTVGEVAVYNRVLTLAVIQNHHQATKWRYT